MKTIRKESVTPKYVEFMTNVNDMKDNIIYISLKYGVTGHRCLCGCGLLTILPLNQKEDSEEIRNHGWGMTDNDGKLTFTPSVGNYQYPCKSHYIITKGVANFV